MKFNEFLQWLLFPDGLPAGDSLTIQNYLTTVQNISNKTVPLGIARVTKGSYVGDGASSRDIACGLTPQKVTISTRGNANGGSTYLSTSGSDLALTATGFTVDASPWNANGTTYDWVAESGAT